nr:hypothetical protein [Tanacetum cinerariifolium]
IDAAHEVVDFLLQRRVLRHLVARGHHQHQQAYLPAPLGVALQQQVECLEPLRNSLGIVEPVDAENHPRVTQCFLEVPHIAKGMKTNEVGPQHPAYQLGTPGQHPYQLLRRKGDVQKEPDAGLGPRPAQHFG